MAIDKISTGKYYDPESEKNYEFVCIPLQNKDLSSISLRADRIFLNYEKVFYDSEDEIIPELTERYSASIRDQESLDKILCTALVNGSTLFDGLKDKIVEKMKEMQNLE